MGCLQSVEANRNEDQTSGAQNARRTKNWTRLRWNSAEPLTREQLQRMRREFWETQPAYGGAQVIWDALKAACETDVETAKLIIDSAGIIVAAPDMHICYDELGAKYELPQYVLSDPINMAPSNPQHA
ncbi:ubiquitin domain-containing protein 2, partial [Haematococcus lacustris]